MAQQAALDETALRQVVVDTVREELSGLGLAARRGQWPRDDKSALGGDRDDDAEDKDGVRACLSKQRQLRACLSKQRQRPLQAMVMVLVGTVAVLALALAVASSPAAGEKHPRAFDAAVPAGGAAVAGSRR